MALVVVIIVVAAILNRREHASSLDELAELTGRTVTLGVTRGGKMQLVWSVTGLLEGVEQDKAFVTVENIEPFDPMGLGVPSDGPAVFGIERLLWVEHDGTRTRL
jgi:hypothetical protein